MLEAVKESKGAGNFKNLFMYVPNGKPDGVKVIPLAEVAAKDEFMNIKISAVMISWQGIEYRPS